MVVPLNLYSSTQQLSALNANLYTNVSRLRSQTLGLYIAAYAK